MTDFLRWVVTHRLSRKSRGERATAVAALPASKGSEFPVAAPSFAERAEPDELVVTWVGHSSFLLQIGGRNVLLDPVWSDRASPVSFAGPRRHVPPGVKFDSLPPIDLVLVSHDHYDHLDLPTVRRLVREHPDAVWLAPLGVGSWLTRRGAKVAAELDWWNSADSGGLRVTCTPAQHFSGRWLTNSNSTLWCSWTIRSSRMAVFFAGDTGRHPEFGDITRRLGPFDAAFMPIGAYEPRWFMQPVHVAPEEAVDAFREIIDANGGHPCTFIAMHWGTFKLTDEPMTEPPVLTRRAWEAAGLDPSALWIARHGETRKVEKVG